MVVDAGEVGMGGIGGHGHNDVLSFDLSAAGAPLLVDSGTYTYTADPAARQAMRSTAAHNALRIDGQETSRLAGDRWLAATRDGLIVRACRGAGFEPQLAYLTEDPMAINSFVMLHHPFDPYPFILLNLVLSTLAALQAPVIMMSQNRQSIKDRMQATQDYEINLMAEIEIRDLHDKLDSLRYKQWHELWHIQQRQLELLEHLHKEVSHPDQKTTEPGPWKPPEL